MADAIPIDAKALRAALARSAGCATLEELERLGNADHTGGGDVRLAEHVAGCLRCRTELALLKQFDAAAPRPEEEAAASWIASRLEGDLARWTGAAPAASKRIVTERTGRWWQRPIALRPVIAGGLATAFLLLLLVLYPGGREVRPPTLSPDVGAGPVVFRSNAVTMLRPVGDLDEPATELSWEAVPGAASYSVHVMEVDRTEVWRTEARQPGLSLPPTVRARIVPGKPLLWQVVAKDVSGKTVAMSQVQRFRVRLREPPRGQ
ncbi:MAG: hypothetical protein ACJ79L_06120 [Anaeromyxobacteraceae bacterium]